MNLHQNNQNREWILFYVKILDRINRIDRISFDRFPEENGQTLSPSAKSIINVILSGIENIVSDFWVCYRVCFFPPQADGVFLVSSGKQEKSIS